MTEKEEMTIALRNLSLDRAAVRLMREDRPFFSLKLCYDEADTLVYAALDGQVIA